MAYSTGRDGFKRWHDLKQELGIVDGHPEYEDPDVCQHPRGWRAGVGDPITGAQSAEWCGKCNSGLPEELWVLWVEG